MTDTRRWLKKEERRLYNKIKLGRDQSAWEGPEHKHYREYCNEQLQALESLAECKRLLKKHEWIKKNGLGFCLECHKFRYENHADDCALARQTAGVPVKDFKDRISKEYLKAQGNEKDKDGE